MGKLKNTGESTEDIEQKLKGIVANLCKFQKRIGAVFGDGEKDQKKFDKQYQNMTETTDAMNWVVCNTSVMNYLETQIKGAGVNVDAKYAPPKKEGRSVYKYIYKYNMDARCLTDVLRHSFVFENMKDLVTGLTTIKKICGDEFVAKAFKLEDKIPQEQNSTVACKLTLLRIKNRFHEESITGYRDINLNVLMEWTQ